MTPPPLSEWHARLMAHFTRLHGTRGEWPVFGLEHGLSQDEWDQLKEALRASIQLSRPDMAESLPWVVYASEFGYLYEGDSFWPEFEERTPGWKKHGNRVWLRNAFIAFAEAHHGAVPDSPWARFFKNICWPITHGILPRDLQRQLVALLYDLRYSLTPAAFESAESLGAVLHAAASNATSRFDEFAQNEVLLGHIAAQLLFHGSDTVPLLLPETLERIVGDIAAERDAGNWLKEARSRVGRLSIRGLGRLRAPSPSHAQGREGRGEPELAMLRLGPEFRLRPDGEGWVVEMTLPSMSPIAVRWPECREYLLRARPYLNIANGKVLPRGILLSGFDRRIEAWPTPGATILELENPPGVISTINSGLRFPSDPIVLFKIGRDGIARHISERNLIAGQSYIVAVRPGTTFAPAIPLVPITVTCVGIAGQQLAVPAIHEEEWEEALSPYGFGLAKSLEVAPAGLPARRHDGQGYCETNVGRSLYLRVDADFPLRKVWARLDGHSQPDIDLPDLSSNPIFLKVPPLEAGGHRLELTAESPGGAVVAGNLTIVARLPGAAGGTMLAEGGLLVSLSPPRPSMEAVWETDFDIGIYGPKNAVLRCTLSFVGRNGTRIGNTKRLTLQLPVTMQEWRAEWQRVVKGDEALSEAYDLAREMTLLFDIGAYGTRTLSARRERTPLRWYLRRESRAWSIQLLDDALSADLTVQMHSCDYPNHAVAISRERAVDGIPIPSEGALFVAQGGGHAGRMVVAPTVVFRDLSDLSWDPRIDPPSHDVGSIKAYVELSASWEAARTGGSAFAPLRRVEIIDSVLQKIFRALCGDKWSRLEALLRAREISIDVLSHELGPRGAGESIAQELARVLATSVNGDAAELAPGVADVVRKHYWTELSRSTLGQSIDIRQGVRRRPDHVRWIAECGLTLSSSPLALVEWAGPQLETGIAALLGAPRTCRALRWVGLQSSVAFRQEFREQGEVEK